MWQAAAARLRARSAPLGSALLRGRSRPSAARCQPLARAAVAAVAHSAVRRLCWRAQRPGLRSASPAPTSFDCSPALPTCPPPHAPNPLSRGRGTPLAPERRPRPATVGRVWEQQGHSIRRDRRKLMEQAPIWHSCLPGAPWSPAN